MAEWEEAAAARLRLLSALERRDVLSGLGLELNYDFTPSDLHGMFRAAEAVVRQADPVFVSTDVVDLWDEARLSFAPESLQPTDPFVPDGFALLSRPLALAPDNAPLCAIAWSTVPDGVSLFGFAPVPSNGDHLYRGRVYAGTDAEAFRAQFFPWWVGHLLNMEFGEPRDDAAVRAVQAFWRLGREFVLSKHHLSRPRRREVERLAQGRPHTEYVTVLRLRRLMEPGRTIGASIDWSCQWIVRGHWRNQWCPSEQVHRQVYVHPYVKGPPDKPLRVTERVVEFVR